MPERAAPTAGTRSASASSIEETSAPSTVGTSFSDAVTAAPKHSASTERSINPTEAAEGTLSATAFIAFA